VQISFPEFSWSKSELFSASTSSKHFPSKSVVVPFCFPEFISVSSLKRHFFSFIKGDGDDDDDDDDDVDGRDGDLSMVLVVADSIQYRFRFLLFSNHE